MATPAEQLEGLAQAVARADWQVVVFVAAAAAGYWNVRPDAVLSFGTARRFEGADKRVALARDLTIYVLLTVCEWPSERVAKALGAELHVATVRRTRVRIEDALETDARLDAFIASLSALALMREAA